MARDDAGRFGLPVPRAGAGVCATCHGPARDGGPDCWCCRTVALRLGLDETPRPLVVPVGLCRNGDALHRALRGYKDAPVVAARQHFAARIGSFLGDFVVRHASCIEGAAATGWDSFAVVPSSGRPSPSRRVQRPGGSGHPLVPIVRTVLAGSASLVDLEPGDGGARHLLPDRHAFDVVGEVRGRRVLVLDDTWVTGARIRSAACALQRAGARVVALVVVGRIVDTGAAFGNARWWSWVETPSHVGRGVTRGPCCMSQCRWASR